MDEHTKTLDVSYGNFSCRLEGFDDSVETMKTIVSYFHELAGHDRFMDMESQAPDMETLARLTQEQVGAPVEIEGEGLKVSLRMAPVIAADLTDDIPDEQFEDDIEIEESTDDGDTIILTAQDEEEAAEALGDVEAMDDTAVEDSDFDFDDEDEDDGDDFSDSESVAEKLQRIRAVVGKDVPTPEANEIDDTFAEDLSEAATQDEPVRGNPLAQRLADLAKRNADRAAEEAGIELNPDENIAADAPSEDDNEEFEDDLSPEELAELDAEFAEEEDTDTAPQDAATRAEPLQLGTADLIEDQDLADHGADDKDDGPLVLGPSSEVTGDDEDVADAPQTKRNDLRNTVDANMSRILSQTDEHLNEPEGRRHRDAFAQLKAAVAATEAARQLGDPGATTRDKNEVFRDDLGALDAEDEANKAKSEAADDTPEDVIEAHDAPADQTDDTSTGSIEETATETPVETPVPAPLKLVSSQPTDPVAASQPLDAASARLREIANQKETSDDSKGGFTEFAARQGAAELADLLEAAAAYIMFVEGEDDFSRPQVMKKVQLASAQEFSREDGLRAFGRLLRLSRIIKLKNGRFEVAEDTRFRPQDQAAQG